MGRLHHRQQAQGDDARVDAQSSEAQRGHHHLGAKGAVREVVRLEVDPGFAQDRRHDGAAADARDGVDPTQVAQLTQAPQSPKMEERCPQPATREREPDLGRDEPWDGEARCRLIDGMRAEVRSGVASLQLGLDDLVCDWRLVGQRTTP
jgi:hypothetical protein